MLMYLFKLYLLSFLLFHTNSLVPKRYTLNYDLPLEPQYQRIFGDYKQAFTKYLQYANNINGIYLLKGMAKIFSFMQSNEWKELINMFSRISGFSVQDFIIANISYEIFCSSIVIRNDQGIVFMGRNLDFYPKDYLSNLVYEFNVVKNNKQVYTAISFVGLIGILNAVKPGKFTVSLNQRYNSSSKFKNVLRFAMGYKSPIYSLQEIIEKADSYDQALSMMRKNKISSPCYFIISGVKENEGAIITRSFSMEVNLDTLNMKQWYLVQTNYDRTEEDPTNDYRRIPAEEKIKNIGKSINYTTLYQNVLRKKPNYVDFLTVYTTIQSANETYFNTTVYENEN